MAAAEVVVLAVDVAEDVVGDAEEAVGGVSKNISCNASSASVVLGRRREVLGPV